MSLIDNIKEKAKSKRKRIVLPEGTELRMIQATQAILKEGIADITLIGDRDEISKVATEYDISGAEIIDPSKSEMFDAYVNKLVELRKHKGMTPEKASELMKKPTYYGAMMVKLNDADGMVAGAVSSTPDVWRPVLQIIKTKPGIPVASSCFLMEVPDCEYGEEGLFLFADCGLNPNPTADQLAAIAVATADTAKTLANMEPKVAMLSFSTKGSTSHELVDKVVEATKIAKEMRPELLIDGELQADAAIDSKVAGQKCPGSEVAGCANILVFPDLQSGNIAYKLIQRLANAMALGPLSQGLDKPVNDLSRGCSSEDIVNVVAITAVEAQE